MSHGMSPFGALIRTLRSPSPASLPSTVKTASVVATIPFGSRPRVDEKRLAYCKHSGTYDYLTLPRFMSTSYSVHFPMGLFSGRLHQVLRSGGHFAKYWACEIFNMYAFGVHLRYANLSNIMLGISNSLFDILL